MIDIAPTIYDITGVQPPQEFEGVCQIPVQGKSIRATFDSRGIWHKGWKASPRIFRARASIRIAGNFITSPKISLNPRIWRRRIRRSSKS